MNDAEKRQYVANLYPGAKWKKRVERMPDDQITAIYLKLDNDELPDHEETDMLPDMDIEPQLDIPGNVRGPHADEDDFPII